jgi:hypothetical protein
MGRLAVAIALAVTLAGCGKDPVKSESTSNPAIEYDVLFERRGCEVGRFYDTRWVYLVICGNGSARADYQVSNGKVRYEVSSITEPTDAR